MNERKVAAERRGRLLARFERSGMSGAAFAAKHGINLKTFYGWRHRARAEEAQEPTLVEVELEPAGVSAIEVELGGDFRLRLERREQTALAAALLRELGAGSC